ncbi:uncharacterized protein LOC117566688 isoform X1 [Drosophila albomicans]|uniref:Uncharacterized protein LOC117566688 isoform X1 n=2 Tax=Drosophila albomicans TaxID=7291 RepID=A0A6P8WES8_DROAB|nr:uncharacterized protein LOC117566688 isoform X1 [Drosophila albomicans]
MRAIFCALLICSFFATFLGAKRLPMEKLGLHNNYNEIVRDLIKNWESPIVYLRQLGYLPNDYEDTSKIKPNLDALMSRMERDDERDSLRQEVDKSRQHFCGVQDEKLKQKRENANGNEGIKYPTVDQLLAMKQPSLAVAMSAAKVDELMPKQKAADHQADGSNAQLMLLTQLLAKQQSAQVQTDVNQKSEDFLQQLVAKTSPVAVGGMPQVAAAPQQLVGGDANAMSSRPVEAQSKVQIDAPQYLNWDIDSNKLKQISPLEKNAYVDKLVRIYVKKQETQGELKKSLI